MLTRIVDWLVYSFLKLNPEARVSEAVHFFVYDTVKILILLFVMISLVGFLRSFISQEKVKSWLSGKKFFGYFFASLFGATAEDVSR